VTEEAGAASIPTIIARVKITNNFIVNFFLSKPT
jgi:hypothetical protein